MAERKVRLTVGADVYRRLVGRAAMEGGTIQNVVVAACRAYVGEHQRGRVGRGGRPETTAGGPPRSDSGSSSEDLDLRIGVNTCAAMDARALRDGVTFHTALTRALREWLGMSADMAAAAQDTAGPPPASVVPTRDAHVAPLAPLANVKPLTSAGETRPQWATSGLGLDSFIDMARTRLAPIQARSGNVLYSGVETLRAGQVYLLGLNPGGDPEDAILLQQTIGSTLAALATKHENEWLDRSWRRNGIRTPPGQSLLQQRVQYLLRGLGLEPRDVCSANLIFARSRDAATSSFEQLAPLCWPVHEAILDIVRPRLVVAFGNSGFSPYGYLRSVLQADHEDEFASGHGDWVCKAFDARRFKVAGVPHLGRYAIDRHPEVVAWLRGLLVRGAAGQERTL